MARGHLRIYLGAAPGVGKTYAMLGEGQRRRQRGTDVVIGYVEDHDRPMTAAMADGLEVVARSTMVYRDSVFTEMDADAVLARHPEQVLVDELAHTNVPGARHEKRWQDVEDLLDAGIDVITTLNIQHLASLNDVVQVITGTRQRETIPDEVVRRADQIELVDMTPEALRRRMAHGNIYSPDKVDAALSHYFRVGNLSALRELALLWLADRVDEGLQRYRAAHGIDSTWQTRERIVVCLSGGLEGATLIRRAARVAARGGADLLAVHVARGAGLTGADPQALAEQRSLVEHLGGSYHQVLGDNVPDALLAFARAENATQLVLGDSRRSRLAGWLTGPGIGATTIRRSGSIDVHVVTHEEVGLGRAGTRLRGALSSRRRVLAWLVGAGGLPLLTLLLTNLRGRLNLPSELLLYLVAVVTVALIGGLWPAVPAAIAAGLLANYYFTPPLYTFTIADPNNALAIGVFTGVAATVATVVDLTARRTAQAARASAEATTLATLAGTVLRGQGRVASLLDQIRQTFHLTAVAVRERDEAGRWQTVGVSTTAHPPTDEWDSELPIDDTRQLVLAGPPPAASQHRVLAAFATQIGVALSHERLAEQAAKAASLAETDRTRSALLAAVSHDLRTPLASANAAVSSLAASDVHWTESERDELIASAQRSLTRLNHLIEDLLDMSRIHAGALRVARQPVAVEDAVSAALDEVRAEPQQVRVDVPHTLGALLGDQPLVERILVNLLTNALHHSAPFDGTPYDSAQHNRAPYDSAVRGDAPLRDAPRGDPDRSDAVRREDQAPPVLVTASSLEDRIEIRVVDRGPGIRGADKERMFAPFQRLGDTDNTAGVGLGLAIARGLAEAMSGSVRAEDTPGGGLTMTVTLPAAPGADDAALPTVDVQ